MSAIRSRLSYANVMATIAVFIALGGTSAAAVSLKRNSVTGQTVKNGSLTLKDLKPSELKKLRGRAGAPGARGATGPAGATGTPGRDGSPGANGTARAYGRIAADGTVSKATPGVMVSHPISGGYCLTIPGVTPATAVLTASPDFFQGGTSTSNDTATLNTPSGLNQDPLTGNGFAKAWVEPASTGDCPASQFEVVTGTQAVSTDFDALRQSFADEPFTFIVG